MSTKEPDNQMENEQGQKQEPEFPLQGTPLNPIMGEWTSST
ncbi:UNVERIFIED_CONTAM: hypothetical protein ABID98_000592 [Brevibacillus sp. OAP136]|nr:hypothetical protein [Brevibacillus fluminis]